MTYRPCGYNRDTLGCAVIVWFQVFIGNIFHLKYSLGELTKGFQMASTNHTVKI